MSYLLLFLSAFAAATLLPLSSELVFLALLQEGYNPLWIWLSASAGNTLGSALNWLIGRYLTRFEDRRWFPFKPEGLQRSQAWFQKYGVWSLLLAWMPVVGDALTFIAGVMRINFGLFFLLTAIGKSTRYGVILALYFGIF